LGHDFRKADHRQASTWPTIDEAVLQQEQFLEKAVQSADTWDTISEKVFTDERQHGPQLMRQFIKTVPCWCLGFRGRDLEHDFNKR
jgi:hypothetical protein